VDEMIPGDDDEMIPPDDADAVRHEATAARIGLTPPGDLSPKARARHDLFSRRPTAGQDASILVPHWSPPEIPEMIKRDPGIFGGPEDTQLVLQVAILETLLSIENKLINRGG